MSSKLLAFSLGVWQVPLPSLRMDWADVVGVLAVFGFGGGEGLVAGLALGQAVEQVGAGSAAGVGDRRGAGFQQFPYPVKLLPGHDGGESVLHPNRFLDVPGL